MNDVSRYKEAGVDISAGDWIKKQIAQRVRQTHSSRVLHREGAFGGMFSLAGLDMKKPVLVSSIDGVGTKTKVALAAGQKPGNWHRGIGHDLVNHSINDILVCGARPLFFLDYFACAKQDEALILQLIEGMTEACRAAGIALVGGETAQMPDVYAPGEYDLAGCIVGILDEDQIIDGRAIVPGDQILGLPSSGLHTNGYTLARKVLLEENRLDLHSQPAPLRRTLAEDLLEPHRSYLDTILKLRERVAIHGLAHITGGGFEGNIDRILPPGCQARIDTRQWRPLPIFQLIQERGGIGFEEMYRVFNMGIGMTVILSPRDTAAALPLIPDSVVIGEVGEGEGVRMIAGE